MNHTETDQTKRPLIAARRVVIVGATSGIARAVAHRLASRGYALVLAARDREAAERDAADLRVRYRVEVETRPFDALDFDSHGALVDGLDLAAAVVCHGIMLSNEDAVADIHDHRKMVDINYPSYASVLEVCASYFEDKGDGVIAAISSVAGDRGRPSNYCY
ncbi:MAG: SDR family NAD(P)-dependent oxidoreductase, partial [Phycisphaerales bacterium JB063]